MDTEADAPEAGAAMDTLSTTNVTAMRSLLLHADLLRFTSWQRLAGVNNNLTLTSTFTDRENNG